MKTIKKKILPKYFGAVVTGAKQFELRKDDDDIQVGDELELIEWDGEPTGKVVRCDVTYVLRNCVEYGLMDGYCIVGISTPTVDAVPVVRCKDCVYCKRFNDVWRLPKSDELLCTLHVETYHTTENDFCSWGERRKNGGERMTLRGAVHSDGHWVHGREVSRDYIGDICVSIHYDKWWCSECNYPVEGQPLWRHCPNCGAKMGVETK